MRLRKENVHVLRIADDMVLVPGRCGQWGREVGVGGDSEVFVGDHHALGDQRIEENRIGKASRAIHGVIRKLKVDNAIMISTVMFESETWLISKQHELAVQGTEMTVLRMIAEKRSVPRARNVKISRGELKPNKMEKCFGMDGAREASKGRTKQRWKEVEEAGDQERDRLSILKQ